MEVFMIFLIVMFSLWIVLWVVSVIDFMFIEPFLLGRSVKRFLREEK